MKKPERPEVLSLLRKLRESPLGEHLILAGSSGLFGASETIPALTEDVDVLVDADWVAAHEPFVVDEMRRLGFEHGPGTPTFTSSDGLSLDLVGFSRHDAIDRIGGGEGARVMVFGDLSRLLAAPGSTVELATGGRALSASALVTAKLLTIRVEKGSKDKLQALLLIEEQAEDPGFLADLRRYLELFGPDRVEDALADAQMAYLAVTGDPMHADPQAIGYLEMSQAAARGLEVVRRLMEPGQEDP